MVAAEPEAWASLLFGFGHWRMQAPVLLVYNQSQGSRTDGGKFSTRVLIFPPALRLVFSRIWDELRFARRCYSFRIVNHG